MTAHTQLRRQAASVAGAAVALLLGTAVDTIAGGSRERVLRVMTHDSWALSDELIARFERDNEVFKEWLEKAKEARAEADKKKEKNPYKLRIM